MILDPSHSERDYKEANMYLAEDRILSLGIYCQQDRKYYLEYVPDAIAYTDPMKSHEQLMIQRSNAHQRREAAYQVRTSRNSHNPRCY